VTVTQCLTNCQLFNEKEMPNDNRKPSTTERSVYLEQERMQAWMDEMKNHPVEQNEMKKKLNDA